MWFLNIHNSQFCYCSKQAHDFGKHLCGSITLFYALKQILSISQFNLEFNDITVRKDAIQQYLFFIIQKTEHEITAKNICKMSLNLIF